MLKIMQEKISSAEVSERIEWLTTHTPYRIAGSEDERKAAEYICGFMKAYCDDYKNEKLYAYNSYPISSELELMTPVREVIKSLPYAHTRSTREGGEMLELLYVGNGGYEAYEGVEAKGKLVLVEVSYAPPVPEKARIAAEMGAAGIICMNWGSEENEVISNRGLKAVWGNPTEETLGHIPKLIGLGVTRKAGLKLKQLCLEGHKPQVKVNLSSTAAWSQVHQPMGIIKGNGSKKGIVLVSSHLDAWCPGVTCNATGNATTIELMKVLSQHKAQLDRDIWFVFWNGHEIAEAAGSTWFADHYWRELNRACIAYINIDSTGMKEATLFEIKASDELLAFSKDNATDQFDFELRTMRLKKIGDQSFMGLGVPAVAQRMSFTEAHMQKNHGATLGWWNHTAQDGVDKYDADNILKDIQSTLSLLVKLSNVALLPYDFDRKFDNILTALNELNKLHMEVDDLGDLIEAVEQAKGKVGAILRRVKALPENKFEAYNTFALKVVRELTYVFQTNADKYQQDSYGHTSLSCAVPLLFNLTKMRRYDKTSFEYGLLETQLVKNKNRIMDALDNVIYISELFEETL